MSASKYMQSIAHIPTATHEQNIKMAKEGDIDGLVISNLRFVVHIVVNDFGYLGEVNYMDLISEGNRGLMIAAERFDPDRGVKFTSYSQNWIRMMIRRYRNKQRTCLKISTTVVDRVIKIKKARYLLHQEGNCNPSLREIANKADLPNTVKDSTIASYLEIKLDNTISLDGVVVGTEDATYIAMIEDNKAPKPTDGLFNGEIKKLLHHSINVLDDREKEIILRRFGLKGYEPETLHTISKDLDICRERVRQLEERALRKMRREYLKYEKA